MPTREQISAGIIGRGPTGDFGRLDPLTELVVSATAARMPRSATESPVRGDEAASCPEAASDEGGQNQSGLDLEPGLRLAVKIINREKRAWMMHADWPFAEALGNQCAVLADILLDEIEAAHAAPRT
jgi:hypothetical protein